MIRTTYVPFQTSTTILTQGNLTSDHEIKQHIWWWKDKEDCTRSAVPYVILIIWMTVAIHIKRSTIISLKCHYFFTQSQSSLMHLSHFGKVFTIVIAEITLLNYSCCTIGDLQVLCHWPKYNNPMCKVSTICWIFLKFRDCSNPLCLLHTVWGLLCSRIIPHDRCSCLCLLVA